MALTRDVVVKRDDFMKAQAITTTAGGEFGWTIKDTSATGTPTYAVVSGDSGALELKLASTSEAEYVTLFQNDILTLRLDQILYVEYVVQVAGVNSVTTIVWGIAGPARTTHGEAPDNETYNAWFRMEGSASTANIVLETDDTVADNDDKSSGPTTLAAVYKRCTIDFSYGIDDVRFFIDGNRVGSGTTFDMGNSGSQRMQLYCDVQKASGAGTPSLLISSVEVARKIVDN